MIFENREAAGKELANYLDQDGVEADMVLTIPYNGLPVGKEVATKLKLPLDVISARKICAPGDPESTIGAVTSEGQKWLNDDLIQGLEIDEDYIEKKSEEQRSRSLEDLEFLRGVKELPDVNGKRIILVDDGIITEPIAVACLKQLKSLGAEHVTLATPVGPERNYKHTENEADDLIILNTPRYFGPVNAFYKNHENISGEEARRYITQKALD